MTEADRFLDVGSVDSDRMRQAITDAITDWSDNRPRSLQKEIGPSQAGAACARRLAWSMPSETPNTAVNGRGDPLPSVVGTAVHAVMEEIMAFANQQLGRERWLTETRVLKPIAGTCDLYDRDTRTVIDWKAVGPTALKRYTTKGPSVEYHNQVHLYGLGFRNLGFEVDRVGIMFLPRAGRLSQAHLWMEEYDEQRAVDVAERLENIRSIAEALDVGHHPERGQHIPATPSDGCQFCPFWSPKPRSARECPGPNGDPNAYLLGLGGESGESG